VCVEDDDGGTGCGMIPVTILNADPVVDAGPDRLAYPGEGLAIEVPFSDGGSVDVHTATIDWGDGTVEEGTVSESGGSGTVSGLHSYDLERTYTVTVCVADDDSGEGCDSFEVLWIAPVLDLAIDKTAGLGAARPGDVVPYTIVVANAGTREPEDVVVTDVLPPNLGFLAASDGGVFDAASRTVTWILPRLAYQASATLTVTAQAESGLPFGIPAVNQVSVADDGRFGPDANPGDNVASATVFLWDAVTPRIHLGEARGTENEVLEL
ncbi:MAG: DUF11 domain-containing protein, partial [Planctomycetes bacterium]|nr:DUF11 domain-containing protein [Planctomycetota bacterium]